MYLMVCTRPDIAHAVGTLTRYMSCPATSHWLAAKGVVRYLSSSAATGITLGPGLNSIVGYTDSDYAGDDDTRRSTTGCIFLLNGGAINWASRLQACVALSTAEAELMAA